MTYIIASIILVCFYMLWFIYEIDRAQLCDEDQQPIEKEDQ